MNGTNVIAIDIGGTKTLVAIVRLEDGAILQRALGATDTTSPEAFVAGVKKLVQELLSAKKYRPEAIGIGTAGHVNPENGHLTSLNLGLDELPIRAILSDFTGLPVFVDNDANVGAIGEMYYGAAKGKRHFAFLSVGTGIGVGLVLGGALYHGKQNNAGEIGHMGVSIHGDKCKCGGSGCLENLASGPGLVRLFKEGLRRGHHSDLQSDEILPYDMFAAAEKNKDPLSIKVIADAAKALGYGVRNLNNLLDLELVVVGGGIALAAPSFFMEQLNISALGGSNRVNPSTYSIVLSNRYPDSIILGAARLVEFSHRKAE